MMFLRYWTKTKNLTFVLPDLSYFVPCFPRYLPIIPFAMEGISLFCSIAYGNMYFLFYCIEAHREEVTLSLRRQFGLLNNTIVKTLKEENG